MYCITPIKVGECLCPGPLAHYLSDWDRTQTFYYYCWLVRGPGRNILVDTGFELAEARRFMPEMRQADNEALLPQLRAHGVAPDEIDTVIITHVHFDHCSSLIERFGNATIVIQQKELAYQLNPPHPWFSQFTVMPILHKMDTDWRHRLQVICGDAEVIPGISVLCTGGHSPGLQSVRVRTAAGPVAITSDVVFFYENLQRDIPVGFLVNLEECYRAMARFRAEFGLDRVIPSHDPLVLQRWGKAQ